MSAYLDVPVEIDTMVCTTCGTASFAWLAEIFVCPICGEFEYAFQTFSTDTDRSRLDTDKERPEITDAELEGDTRMRQHSRKRKRPLNDK